MKFFWIGILLVSLSVSGKVQIKKHIAYRPLTSGEDASKAFNQLDVYTPKGGKMCKVLLFIHGGSWNSGKKETYKFLGKGFAKKGIVVVVMNYRLSPSANYVNMMQDCADALKWIHENIGQYGGDSNAVFVSGHSAGGHLSALLANDTSFYSAKGLVHPIKGCVLIDAFGLDMASYFPTSTYASDASFKITFTNQPVVWKRASPHYYIHSGTVPHLILIGEKTYSSINTQNRAYYKFLQEFSVSSQLIVLSHKGHIGMILQFYRRSNPEYKRITEFMRMF